MRKLPVLLSKRIYVMNGESESISVLNAADGSVVGTIALGGSPEFAVSDGKGSLYVNLEEQNETFRSGFSRGRQAYKVQRRVLSLPGSDDSGQQLSACGETRSEGLTDTLRRRFLGRLRQLRCGPDPNRQRPVA
jgi:YVTN family beta-propeller protein